MVVYIEVCQLYIFVYSTVVCMLRIPHQSDRALLTII
jgi:hypothetical protein